MARAGPGPTLAPSDVAWAMVFAEWHRRRLATCRANLRAAIALDNRRLMQEKDQMAVRDGLTGVYNRRYLGLTLDRRMYAVKGTRRTGSRSASPMVSGAPKTGSPADGRA